MAAVIKAGFARDEPAQLEARFRHFIEQVLEPEFIRGAFDR
jgi:hypothetical protein